MGFKTDARNVAKAVETALGIDLDDGQIGEVTDIIEQAILRTAVETTKNCSTHAVACCPADQDIAHKIARKLKQAEDALVANLSALR